PLLYNDQISNLVKQVKIATPVPMLESAPPQAAAQPAGTHLAVMREWHGPVFEMPREIPRGVSNSGVDTVPIVDYAYFSGSGSACPGCSGVPEAILPGSGIVPLPPPPTNRPAAVRTSAMMEGSLLHRVEPVYPAIAKAAGIQGTVVLAAVIGRDGAVERLK